MTFSKNFSLDKEDKVRTLRFEGPRGFTDTTSHNFLIPSASVCAQPSQAFNSNPRDIQLSAKFTF